MEKNVLFLYTYRVEMLHSQISEF